MTKWRFQDAVPPVARTLDEWRAWAESKGEKSYRGTQVFKWIHARKQLDPQAMTDLSLPFRTLIEQDLRPRLPTIEHVHESQDETRKLLLRMSDGTHVETVLFPMMTQTSSAHEQEGDESSEEWVEEDEASGIRTRVTQCISTQAGCAMKCTFCASGAFGLERHLGPDEIVAQVLIGYSKLRPEERLTNVVLMGMGEPLHNYDATVRAVRILADNDGLGLSTRRITISTVGLIPELERLGKDFRGRIALAVSLHAPNDELRSRLVPANRRYPLVPLMAALRRYPLPPRRRITIEYALIQGVNDEEKMAVELIELLRGIPVKVNLIPLNPVAHSELHPSTVERVMRFQRVLIEGGLSCFVRKRRGDDISAACGQLAGKRRVLESQT